MLNVFYMVMAVGVWNEIHVIEWYFEVIVIIDGIDLMPGET